MKIFTIWRYSIPADKLKFYLSIYLSKLVPSTDRTQYPHVHAEVRLVSSPVATEGKVRPGAKTKTGGKDQGRRRRWGKRLSGGGERAGAKAGGNGQGPGAKAGGKD